MYSEQLFRPPVTFLVGLGLYPDTSLLRRKLIRTYFSDASLFRNFSIVTLLYSHSSLFDYCHAPILLFSEKKKEKLFKIPKQKSSFTTNCLAYNKSCEKPIHIGQKLVYFKITSMLQTLENPWVRHYHYLLICS